MKKKDMQASPANTEKKPGAIIINGNCQGLGLLRSLARQNVPTCLLDRGLCIGRFSRYARRFLKCPDVKEEALFLKFLTDLAIKENLKGWLLYPNDDETVYLLSRYKEPLEEYYRVTTPSWEVVKYAYDKMLTYRLAEQCDIAVPRTWYPRNAEELEQLKIEFPVILKPSIKDPFFGHTRQKAIRVDDRSELMEKYHEAAQAIDQSQTIMVQELIPGGAQGLFSVGSLFRDGGFLAKVVARRPRQHPMDFGHASTYVETVDIPELEVAAGKILRAMGYDGLSEVEFMLDPRDRKYKLIEINARAWGWHTLGIIAGVDFPYLSYLDRLGERVKRNGFAREVKWIHLTTDIPTVIAELFAGRMKFTDYLHSLRGKKQDAVLSISDPMPFIAELAMLPYLWIKRAF
jgi:predicted ATP-grasp superfamily ATP-dependent carboligase